MQNALLESCGSFPAGSFGKAYYSFMDERRFEADFRPPVRFVDDVELAYVATRMREVHDFWHVLFDCDTNVFGETALKALEFVQVRTTVHFFMNWQHVIQMCIRVYCNLYVCEFICVY